MTDQTINVTAASDIQVDKAALDASIGEFVERNPEYYVDAFHKIHNASGFLPRTFNVAAALLGPFWSAARGIWGFFWTFIILEMIAWVQLGRGLWGDLGADDMARVEMMLNRAETMTEKAEAARAAGEDPTTFDKVAANMTRAAEKAQAAADQANSGAMSLIILGVVLLVAVKLYQGFRADVAYEKQYSAWRINPATESGYKPRNMALGVIFVLAIAPLTIYKFTVAAPWEALDTVPIDKGLYTTTSNWLESAIDTAAANWSSATQGITYFVRTILEALTVALIDTPWPVIIFVILVMAWRLAGVRVAIFSGAVLAYIAILGFWDQSMETVALVGAAVIVSVAIGIPLGIWFGKSRRAYSIAEPVLDLMQTLPAFVYLIPIIAFFGTGNPPGILATIIFGMPPVIRLTALGMRGVPDTIKEAAMAFGASRWQLLKGVEAPLALPSIMAGVNQTILMCLSMTVIISLIGGGGLGKAILEALQYAAKGPGILAGLAILFCAMVMDRIAQGAFKRADHR